MRDPRDALSFGSVVDAYDRARPRYPTEAVDWLVPTCAHRVLDLGCGTGKLTEALVARKLDVVAVDPLGQMLARLRAKHLRVATLVGTAEAIPLPDATVDAVLVAQAWHWVNPARALPEIARVLRPGGTFGLVWNVRDASVAWVGELSRVLDGGAPVPHFTGTPVVGPFFPPLDHHEFRWERALSEADLCDLAASRSHYATMVPKARASLLEAVRSLFRDLPRSPLDARRIAMPYVTHSFRTRLPEGRGEAVL